MAGQMHQQLVSASSTNKKQGVSGESSDAGQTAEDIQIVRFDKDFRYASNSLVQGLLRKVDSYSVSQEMPCYELSLQESAFALYPQQIHSISQLYNYFSLSHFNIVFFLPGEMTVLNVHQIPCCYGTTGLGMY
jgi:hypothetical protein